MPRIARSDLETSFFHVIIQGINKEYIFKKDEYKERYLQLVYKYKKEYKTEVIAYCIMDNHAHMLIYCDETEKLGNFMHRINSIYGQNYNRQEKRAGYVFRNRYVSEAITDEYYLIRCIDYIHKNPVKAGIVNNCKEYKYSTYNSFINNKEITRFDLVDNLLKKYNYAEITKLNNDDMFFYDIDINREEFLDKAIKKFEDEKQKNIVEILENKMMLKELISILKIDYKITYVEMMRKFEISKGKMENLKR